MLQDTSKFESLAMIEAVHYHNKTKPVFFFLWIFFVYIYVCVHGFDSCTLHTFIAHIFLFFSLAEIAIFIF